MASFAHTEYCMPRWHWTTTATLKTLLKERAKSARGEDSVASGAHYVHIAPTPVAASLTAGRDGRCTPGTMRWPLKKRQSQPRQGLRHLTICNRARASTSAARGSLVGQAFLATQSGAACTRGGKGDRASGRRRRVVLGLRSGLFRAWIGNTPCDNVSARRRSTRTSCCSLPGKGCSPVR
eukprot:scaffold146921_cov31-Tisochrysis_lutea.AAC.1